MKLNAREVEIEKLAEQLWNIRRADGLTHDTDWSQLDWRTRNDMRDIAARGMPDAAEPMTTLPLSGLVVQSTAAGRLIARSPRLPSAADIHARNVARIRPAAMSLDALMADIARGVAAARADLAELPR